MKKDIKLYDYHTTCPNCDGFNTRLNKALNMEYVMCYACSLIFKPSNDEIEKMRTPLPIEMAIHKDLENISNQEIDFLKKVHETNINLKIGDLDLLDEEIGYTFQPFLNKKKYNNIVIFSNFGIERKIDNCTIIAETDHKNIEKILYTKILKNCKID